MWNEVNIYFYVATTKHIETVEIPWEEDAYRDKYKNVKGYVFSNDVDDALERVREHYSFCDDINDIRLSETNGVFEKTI